MSTDNPFLLIATLCIAWATSWCLSRRFIISDSTNRQTSIDGLRGYLALLVFIHHSSIWYFYLHDGAWLPPPSRLFANCGQISVALFFMITAFLFYSRLVDSREKPIDWTRLFVSRLLRLTPMYLVMVFGLLMVVGALSGWTLHETPQELAIGITQWFVFTIFGGPNLNGVSDTGFIVAGVTWTLTFEWLFYLTLPLLALTVRRPPFLLLGICASALILIIHFGFLGPKIAALAPFIGGMASVWLSRLHPVRRFAVSPLASVLVLSCLAIATLAFPTVYRIAPLILISAAFLLLVSGNTLFGILSWRSSRLLGESTYSIYLLHGLLLSVFFRFFIGKETARTLSPEIYAALILGLTPILVLISFVTFRLIESPSMQHVQKILHWLRSNHRSESAKITTQTMLISDINESTTTCMTKGGKE